MANHSTSIESYNEVKSSGQMGEQQALVFNKVQSHGPISRSALAASLGMGINSVCGRVNELMQMNKIVESHRDVDRNTNRSVWFLKEVK